MHSSILMCFLSVSGLCSAFFLSKDNGKPFVLCHKICPLYCPKNRRQDDDASFLVYSDDHRKDTIDYDFKTKIPSRFFLHCKPKQTTTTPSPTTKSTTTLTTTTTSTTTPKPTTTPTTTTTTSTTTPKPTTTTLTTTTSSTTTPPATTTTPVSTTKNTTLLKDTEDNEGSFDVYQDFDSPSEEDSLARDYDTQPPVRFFVDCRWRLKTPSTDEPSTSTNKPTTKENRRYDNDASSHIYVDHHSPYYIDEDSSPHEYDFDPPRRFYAHKKRTTTAKPITTPAPITTPEDPSSHIYVDHDTPYYIDEDTPPHDYEIVPPRFYAHKKWPTTAKPTTTTTAAPTTTTEDAPHIYSDNNSPYYIAEDLPYHDYEIITPYFYVHKKWTTAKPTTTAAPTTTEEPTFICELCKNKCEA